VEQIQNVGRRLLLISLAHGVHRAAGAAPKRGEVVLLSPFVGPQGVENSIYMQSTSGSDGSYTLTITFAIGTDLNIAVALVQNAVNSALPQLPQQVRAQGVNVKKVSTNILLIESLYSDDDRFDETFLSNYALINLQNPLARLPGVG
jgi:HAE1 family hydrophobic/amphiphilic exporter-1